MVMSAGIYSLRFGVLGSFFLDLNWLKTQVEQVFIFILLPVFEHFVMICDKGLYAYAIAKNFIFFNRSI